MLGHGVREEPRSEITLETRDIERPGHYALRVIQGDSMKNTNHEALICLLTQNKDQTAELLVRAVLFYFRSIKSRADLMAGNKRMGSPQTG